MRRAAVQPSDLGSCGLVEHGFQIVGELIPREDIAGLRAEFDALYLQDVGGDVAGASRSGADAAISPVGSWVLHDQQRLRRLITPALEQRTMAAVRQVLAVGSALYEAYLIYKPPVTGVSTPWHQDQAYLTEGLLFERIAVWIPLDDVVVNSGCLHFLPGSHRQALRSHMKADTTADGTDVLAATVTDEEALDAVSVPLAAGSATMHTTRTLHFAAPNTSARRRRVIVLDMMVPASVRPTLFEG